MWAAPLNVACNILDPHADFHPDLDERDLQACLRDRLAPTKSNHSTSHNGTNGNTCRTSSAPRAIPLEEFRAGGGGAGGYQDDADDAEVSQGDLDQEDKEIAQTKRSNVSEEEQGETDNAQQEQDLFVFSPVHEGWLIKRGSGGLRIWRRRWVSISNSRIWYASGPPARKEDGGYDK